MKRLRPVLTVLFVLITAAFFFSFATSSHAITITGSEEITTNSSATYTAADCSGTVSWSVTGTGASISSNGVLTAGSASCGGITVTASCSDGSIATKTARVTNAGQWVMVSNCYIWNGCIDCCAHWPGHVFTTYMGNKRYDDYWVRICTFPNSDYVDIPTCSPSSSQPSIPECGVAGSYCASYHIDKGVICYGNQIYEWQCLPCTSGQTISCYTGATETKGVGICKAGIQTCTNGQWGACVGEVLPTAEICGDGKDNNCDGQVDEGCAVCEDKDGDGYYAYNPISCPQGNDCNDNDPTIYPGAKEICDGKDNNCDGQIDETCLGNQCGIPLGSTATPASGNLYHDQTLFQTAASGFTLSYNSIDIYNSSLGKGWTHNWNIFLFSNPDGSLGLKQGDGRIIYFKLNQGVYYPEAGSGETSYITYNNSTYTLTEKNGTTYTFNTSGKLTSIKDRNQNTTTLAYNGDNLTTITDPSGRIIYITTSNGKITSITTPDNRVYRLTYSGDSFVSVADPELNTWQYTYNANNTMLTKIDPQGYVTTYTYDTEGKVISSIDPEGKTKAITYDPINQTAQATEKDGGIWIYKYDPLLNVTTQKTDPQGNVTTYTYDQNKNLISTKEPDGSTTSYTYDTNRNRTSVTDALGNITSYTYNTLGQITSVTDSQNKTTTYTYDARGNLLSITDPSGAITQYQYDSKGNVISITNANGQTTTLAYDQYNNLSSVTDSSGSTTTFTYDTSGNITSQTDPKGSITRFEYNNLNQLIKITDPQNNITTYTYDKNGNRTSQTDANGKATNYEYNYKGQLIKETDSGGDVTTYVYGGAGCASCGGGSDKLTSIIDSKGRVTSYVYDSIGRLIKIIDPINGTISYTYDSRGRLTSVTDSIGNPTSYEYDSLGRVIKTSSLDTGIITYTYNSVGNMLTKTDANGITTSYSYDALNRLANIKFPDSSENITYTYDNCTNGKGRLCYMTDPSGTTAYEYDGIGRLIKETKTIIGINYTTAYEYDKTGNLTTITYPSGRKVSYTYNSIYRPISVSQQMNKGTKTLANNFIYDKVGNPLSMTLGNGLTEQWAYDQKNRISTIYVPNILNLNYSYDPIGNITAITDNLEPFKSKTYDYDPVDRLITATGPWGNLAWTYDANGNRLSQTNGKTTTYTYDANRLTSVSNGGVNNYQYDNNGNTISDGQKEFVYNQNQRLIKAIGNGKILGEYVYNGKGQRIIKKTGSAATNSSSPQNIVYHYDLSGRLIEETTGNGKLLVDYVYLNSQPLSMIRKQGNNEETFYYHNDHLGTPKVLTDKLQKIVWNIEFDPFGNEIEQKGRQGTYIRSVENNIFFPGQYRDKETGLNQNGFRTYSPPDDRYLEADPIGLDGGTNLYSYGNNPVTYTDPLGLCKWKGSVTMKLGGGKKGGAGAVVLLALKSECCNGKQAQGVYTAFCGGVSVAPKLNMPIQVTSGLYEFDGPTTPSDSDPKGWFSYVSIGGSWGIGGGYARLRTGSLVSPVGAIPSPYAGVDFGLDALIGFTTGKGETTCCTQ
mgnify:FL=1